MNTLNISGALIPLTLCVLLFTVGCGLRTGAAGAGKGVATYEYTTITRGTIEKTVSSSGSLKPVSTVHVLPRMSGKVERIHVDYNDTIHKGDILAELNTDMLRLQREQQLAAVVKTRANYELQLINYRNQERLAEKNLISEYELKTGKTTLDIQAAELSAAEASLRVIETEINQYAFITSPINGIVLERNINEGDTVVDSSSSNSASIFTLAENLDEMQIETGVGELDIASIREGQMVRFTLEALPGKIFSGVVASKRLMPVIADNVVSYTVIITVDNRDGSLLPGMTCAVEFIEEQRENILLVPNAALRYQPVQLSTEAVADMVFNAGLRGMSEEQRQSALAARAKQQTSQTTRTQTTSTNGIAGLVMPGGRGGFPGAGAPQRGTQNSGVSNARSSPQGAALPPRPLWFINDEGKLDIILVQTGISNGSSTELRAARGSTDAELEGRRIILRERL
ncbi:MAG: efflux RND transporter periplasmic adaptor subunit [Treponema sp.]|nr:efflux RND transporter periplasmic adaptor subunit [Treponema sp.]